MIKIKNVLLGLCGVCLLTTMPLAQAQNAQGPQSTSPKWHSEGRVQEIYGQLNLTDAQKKQLEDNKHQHRAIMEAARQEIKADKQALQEELMKPQLDMAKITALHSQVKDLLSKMEDNKLSSILAVRTILTPDQFLKFVNLMHKHRQEHEK